MIEMENPVKGNVDMKNLLQILDSVNDLVYVTNIETYEILFANAPVRKLFGNDVIGKKCYEAFHKKTSACEFCTKSEIISGNTGKTYTREYKHTLNERWYKYTDRAILWADGKYERLVIARDIQKLRKAEKLLEGRSVELNERVKELKCLYSVAGILSDSSNDIDIIIREVLTAMKEAWQYPDITEVKVEYGNTEYYTPGWQETEWVQREDFYIKNKKTGSVEVVFLKEMPQEDEGPFLDEERQLIKSIANKLSRFAEQRSQSEELQKYKESLEEIISIRTNELAEANRMLKKEIENREIKDLEIDDKNLQILELSTPILKISDDILAVPLVGKFDSERANMFTEKLLNKIYETNAAVAILDITGVPTIDTYTAQYIDESVIAAKLLGTKVILTGLGPSVVKTLVLLGINLSGISTRASLADGLEEAFRYLHSISK